MAKICILSALLLQLLYISVKGQNSPCPDRFTYIKKPGSDETIGEIEIRNPSINNLELRLKVDLKIDTQLPTSFIGGVDLTKSKEDAARDVLEGRPLLYHVYFPLQNPLPTVHRIWFNNHQICSGSEVSGIVVTILTLEHNFKIIIRPAQNQTNSPPQNRPAKQNPNSGGNPFVSPFTFGTTEQAPVDRIENYNDCGISSSSSESHNPLITHRKKTLPGQWPWEAAKGVRRIFFRGGYDPGRPQDFFQGGA